MSQRRSSGEVINATLLEVFLAFVFVVLALAYFESGKVQAAAGEQSAAQARAKAAEERAAGLQRQVDSARDVYLSQFKPACDSGALLLTLKLTTRTRWEVTPRRDIGQITPSASREVRPKDFRSELAPAIADGRARGCKYEIEIVGTDSISTSDYIRARQQLVQVFYPRDSYQRVRH